MSYSTMQHSKSEQWNRNETVANFSFFLFQLFSSSKLSEVKTECKFLYAFAFEENSSSLLFTLTLLSRTLNSQVSSKIARWSVRYCLAVALFTREKNLKNLTSQWFILSSLRWWNNLWYDFPVHENVGATDERCSISGSAPCFKLSAVVWSCGDLILK